MSSADDSARTVADVFDAFGGPSAFSRELGLKGQSTASEMKRRGRISVELWPRIVALAEERSISWLTYERLTLMHARRATASDTDTGPAPCATP